MRIVIDATAVTPRVGGLATYVLGLLNGWRQCAYEDDIVMLTTDQAPSDFLESAKLISRVRALPSPNPLARLATQQLVLPRLVREHRADVLLATTPVLPALPIGAPAVAVVHDLRYLSHPDDFGGLKRRYRSLAYGYAYDHADRLIAISETTRDILLSTRPAVADKTSVIHHGSDHLDAWPRAERQHQAIAFAHWNNKHPDAAIRSWALLRQALPGLDWTLHIVGAEPAVAADLSQLAAELGLVKLVTIHPFLPAARFQELFTASSLLLFPSSEEGFGLPVVEAMRLGVPVVASDIPAFREVAGDRVLFAPPGDDASLARQCSRLIEDTSLWQQMSDEGRQWSQRFSWRATAEQTRNVLVAAVAERDSVQYRQLAS